MDPDLTVSSTLPAGFDPNPLGHGLPLFTDTVAAWYSRHHPGSKTGSVYGHTTSDASSASSDLRLNPHFHTSFLDGV